ncbi:MAG: phosphatase PAP2 family protein, partial [Gemmatimonadota bacterium]
MTVRCLMLGAWCLVAASDLGAQADSALALAARPADFAPLLGLGAAAAIVSPADRWLAQTVRRPAWVRGRSGQGIAKTISFVGATAPFATAAGIWIRGSMNDNRSDQALGRTAAHALLASSSITGALKIALGRARPYVSADSNPRDFRFGRGWRNNDYQSLPSGHATAAFAFAAAVSQERTRVRGRSGSFDAAMYGGATLVALSRMVLDKHWASDILLGAGIGVTSGLVTFRLAH